MFTPSSKESETHLSDEDSENSDSGQQTKAYCQGKWICGVLCVASASCIHVFVLPYLDLTLMACNASTAMICNLILSKKYLGETFVWKHDCTALILICAGCSTIVLNAHTSPVSYDAEAVVTILTSARTLIYFACALIYFLSMIMLTNCYLAKLRLFEKDVDFFDVTRKNQNKDYKPILEPRLKTSDSIIQEEGCISSQEPLIENLDEVQRPARALIDTINEMTFDEIRQVSPDSLKLKKLVKTPLLLIISASGMMSGVSISMLKFTTEMMQSGEFFNHIGFCLFLLVAAFLGAACQLHLLNGAMKFFDQLEVIPIYQTTIMIMWILTGMIVFQETGYYETKQLIMIFSSIAVCCIGIYFLYSKSKYINDSQM